MPLEGHWARVNTPLRKTTSRERRILRRSSRSCWPWPRSRAAIVAIGSSTPVHARGLRASGAAEHDGRRRLRSSAATRRASFCASTAAHTAPAERDRPAEVPRGRVLTERELNRALLARQLLLERGKVAHLRRSLERMGTLQAQYAPSMYIGLWSRIGGIRARAARPGAREAHRRPGNADAGHHPPGLGSRLLADRDRRAARPPRGLAERLLPEGLQRQADVGGRARAAQAARRRHDEPQGDPRAARVRQRRHQRGEHVARPASGCRPPGTWERRRADLYAASDRWLGEPPKKLDERRQGSSCWCGAI